MTARRARTHRALTALVAVAGTVATVATAHAPAEAASAETAPRAAQQGGACPSVVNPRAFASVNALRRLLTKGMSFGQRNLAGRSHNQLIGWLEREVRRTGFRVRSEPFRVWRWLPRTRARGGPGLDIGRAGGLSGAGVGGRRRAVPVAGAVLWS